MFSSRICSLSLEIALTQTQRFFSLIIHHDSTYEEKKNAIGHPQSAEKSVDKEGFKKENPTFYGWYCTIKSLNQLKI